MPVKKRSYLAVLKTPIIGDFSRWKKGEIVETQPHLGRFLIASIRRTAYSRKVLIGVPKSRLKIIGSIPDFTIIPIK